MNFFWLTIKTTLKDRVFIIILSLILVYCFIPVFSYFSMRQVQEIAITMSITLNSFILLVLAIFGGVYTIWRDIERKYTYNLLSFPVSRAYYLLGRYCGFVFILFFIMIIDFFLGFIVIKISAKFYKSDLPILWSNIFIAYFYSFLKYSLLLSFGFMFSSIATSFFTPLFSTVAIFIAGNSIQGIYDYIMTTSEKISLHVKYLVKFLYYILPNFSSFDFTVYASYSLKINMTSLLYSLIYFSLYLCIILNITVIIFNKRDLI